MPMTRSGTNSAPELPHQREVDRNMFKEFNDLADKIEELSISSKACWCRNQAHMFKKIGNINLINISSSVFRSSPELGYSFPLLGSRCNSISTIFLEYSTVATFDGHHMLTDLTDPSACNYEEGVCVSQTSTIVWDVVPKGARFQYEIIGNTVAKIKYNHIILEEYKVAINFSTKNTSNIPCINIIGTHWLGNEAAVSFPQLNSSTHTVYLIQSNSEILQRFRSLTREKRFLPWSKLIINNIAREDNKVRAKLGNVTMAYGAANFSHHPHLQYPYNHLQTALNHRFDSIYQHLCETENNIIAQYVALLKVDPTLAVRAILNRNDISAQWQGEVIALHKCIRISPTEIYYDGKVNGKCYPLIPVRHGTKIYFIVSGSKDLTTFSPEIECDSRNLPVWRDATNRFRTFHGSVHVLNMSIKSSHQLSYMPNLSFTAPNIFYEYNVPIITALGYSQHRIKLSDIGERVEIGHDSIGIHHLKNFGDEIFDIGDKAYIFARNSTNHVFQGIGTEVRRLMNIAVVVAIIIAGVVFILIGLSFYIFCPMHKRWFRFKRSKNGDKKVRFCTDNNQIYITSTEAHDPRLENNVIDRNQFVAAVSPSQLCIPVHINNFPCLALIDTGSACTIMYEGLVRHFNLTIHHTEIKPARTTNGSLLQFSGYTYASIIIGDKIIDQKLLTVTTNAINVMFGIDLLSKLGVFSMDYDNRMFKFDTFRIPLVSTQNCESAFAALYPVIAHKQIVLNPLSDHYFRIPVNAQLPKDKLYIIKGVSQESPIVIGKTISHVRADSSIPIRILNYTNNRLRIVRGELIATIQNIDESQDFPAILFIKEILSNIKEEIDYIPEEVELPEIGCSTQLNLSNVDLVDSIFTQAQK